MDWITLHWMLSSVSLLVILIVLALTIYSYKKRTPAPGFGHPSTSHWTHDVLIAVAVLSMMTLLFLFVYYKLIVPAKNAADPTISKQMSETTAERKLKSDPELIKAKAEAAWTAAKAKDTESIAEVFKDSMLNPVAPIPKAYINTPQGKNRRRKVAFMSGNEAGFFGTRGICHTIQDGMIYAKGVGFRLPPAKGVVTRVIGPDGKGVMYATNDLSSEMQFKWVVDNFEITNSRKPTTVDIGFPPPKFKCIKSNGVAIYLSGVPGMTPYEWVVQTEQEDSSGKVIPGSTRELTFGVGYIAICEDDGTESVPEILKTGSPELSNGW